ncbi:MAG: hypothetical protein KatS3mg033_0551 [Thermonema sp.]|uniref:STAS/SEC14 domain-containing protein n=1 Tax=Thermonema sp. TaxID=2231181 RepID=UPI0021DD799F|nr:STAS/SEC14 domain-containing protein [Thermonema sp.]GIV38751.1 MAG: hypothetical protein KatS3mg033_0551 [Thermonema sp.]
MNSTVEVLHEDDFMKMYFNPSIQCIVKEWKQNPSEDKIKLLILNLVHKIILTRRKYEIDINLLADCRKLTGELFSEQVIDWLNEKIHKMYVANNIRKKAFVASSEIACNRSLIDYIEQSGGALTGLEMRLFDDIEQAKAWLASSKVNTL